MEPRFKSSEEEYVNTRNCLRSTAEFHSIPLVTVLQILDTTDEYRGIRKWFVDVDEKYREKFVAPAGGTRKQAEGLANWLPVIVTGAQPGDILEGTKTQSLGAIVKVFDKPIPPDTDWLNTIRKFPDVWGRFLVRLGSIEFYSSLSLEERKLHLLESSDSRDLYLQDIPGLKLQVLNLGTSKLTKTGTVKERSKFLELSEKQMDQVMNNPTLASKIQDMFPFEPGSKGIKGRSTLLFRRSIWKISVTYTELAEFSGHGIEMKRGKAVLKEKLFISNPRKEVIYTMTKFGNSNEDLAIFTNRHGSLDKEHVLQLTLEFHESLGQTYTKEDFDLVEKAAYTFTPGAYKSLLQKTLRFRPLQVDLGEHVGHAVYPADFVLSVTFALLVTNKGGLVPDIQRYVRGSEAALKRLVVTLFEDCYFEEKDVTKVLAILTGALLTQRIDTWRPNDFLLNVALEMANKALNDDRAFAFSIPRGATRPVLTLTTAKNEFQMLSVMMDELKSFTSDLEMIRDIVVIAYKGEDYFTSNPTRPKVMPLEHCIDQHWAPELVYFAPLKLVEEMKEPGSKPFSKIMRNVFGRVTGVNPRRPRRIGKVMDIEPFIDTFEEQPFVQTVRKMQRLLLLSRQFEPLERDISDDSYLFRYELDRSWIAGMLGAVEIRAGSTTTLVSLRPDLPEIIVAVKKPSRGMKTAILSEETQLKAISLFEEKLEKGLPLNKTAPPVTELAHTRLMKKEDEFYIQRGKKEVVLWDELRKSQEEISYLKDELPLELEVALRHVTDGQERNANERLKELLLSSSSEVIRRLLSHLSGYSQAIKFVRVGREGGGNDKDKVFDTDVGAYQLLLKMTVLYPEAISRIPNSTLNFNVSFGPLMWELRSLLQQEVEGRAKPSTEEHISVWGNIEDSVGRRLYQHQDEAVREMILSHQRGRKGHFIYMKTGMGKTFTVFSYMKWMKDTGVLPKYIIYTTPASALETILREAEFMNFKTVILEPTKGISKPLKEYRDLVRKGCDPLAYHINIIVHDHLKDCQDLSPFMIDSIFIMDEVHKALNNSLRTAAALQLSKLSREMVAMTGTPIIDTKTYKLNTWLAQIVLFEVNERNFWVAANGMVAKQASTGVKVIVNDMPAVFTEEEDKAHSDLVPPKIGGKNTSFGRGDYSAAFDICMKASNRKLLELTKEQYEQGEGVFLVARNKKHQEYLKDEILRRGIVGSEKEIFLIGVDGFLSLTDAAIEKGDVYDYKLVITTLQHVEGYNLSSLSVMITSVYPSNQAVREQLEGRVNRLGQKREKINYYVVYVGIQYFTYLHHKDGRNLSEIVATLADQF